MAGHVQQRSEATVFGRPNITHTQVVLEDLKRFSLTIDLGPVWMAEGTFCRQIVIIGSFPLENQKGGM